MKNHDLQRKKTSYTPSNIPFRIAYQIYFILIGLCCFSLSLSSYIIYETGMDYYEFIIENWKKEPILEVRMVMNGTCNDEEDQLANYDWPGTSSGCDCPYKSLSVGTCSYNESRKGCSTIGSVDGQTFHFPDITYTNWFQICAKRAQNESFYYNLPRKNECENGYLKCGDEEDYFYCTKQRVCPILKIAIKEVSLLDNQQIANDIQTQTLIFTRQMKSQLPIVQFRISEAGVCMRNDERGMTSGRSDYLLMKTKKVDCATDPRFESIIQTNELPFYKINHKDDLPSTLPGYEISDEYKWGLYQRPYILWRMKCRGKDYDEFLDQQVSLNHILDNQLNLLIISIVFLVVISIGFSIVSFVNISGYDWPCIKGKGSEESNYIFYFEILSKLAVQIAQAFIIIKSFYSVKKETDFIDYIVDQQCSDKYVHSQLIDLKNIIEQNVYNFNLGLLILFAITTLLDFIVAIYLIFSYFQQKNSSKNYEMTVVNNNQNQNQQDGEQEKINNPIYENQGSPNYPQNEFQQQQVPYNNNYGIQNQADYQQQPQMYQNYPNNIQQNNQNIYGFQNNDNQQGPIYYGA